jgi:hypothetical protein
MVKGNVKYFSRKKYENILHTLIQSMKNSKRAKHINSIFYGAEIEIINRYLQSPASSQYHDCYPGGLLVHSINVTLKMLNDREWYPESVTPDKIIIVGLFHDIGKIGTRDENFYLPTEGGTYFYNDKISRTLPHAARSLATLQELKFKLEDDEFQAILYHNGMYVSSGRDISNHEYPLTLILHHADMYVSHIFDRMEIQEKEKMRDKLTRKIL